MRQLADGSLASDDQAEVYDHVDDCATCAALLLAQVRPAHGGAAPVDPPALTAQLPAGTQLGRFEVRAVLGSGNMGTVFTGWDPQLARPVAIKVLRAGRTGAEHGRRLLREAKAMAQVRHPNIVTVFDVGVDQDVIFVAMELVGGTTLRAALAAPPSIAVRLEWLAQIAAGLAAVHAVGLLHRDVKPDNIFVERTASGPRVVIGDFGLAVGDEAVPEPVERRISTTSMATRGAGTPAYMAPEQLEAGAIGPATDVFAFGVTAWEVLTGRRPFVGRSAIERREAIDAGPGARLSAPGLAPALATLLEACVAAAPAARPSATALATALRTATGDRRASRRRTALLALGGAALTAAATTGLVLTRVDRAAPRDGGVACDGTAPAQWRATKAAWTTRAAATLAPYARDELVRVMDLRAAAWEAQAPRACAGNVMQRQAWNLCRARLERAEQAILDAAVAGPWPEPGPLLFLVTGSELPSECAGRQAGEAAVELGALAEPVRDRVIAALAQVPSVYVTAARGDDAAVGTALDALAAEATATSPSPLDGEVALARAELQPAPTAAAQVARLRQIAVDAARTASATLGARAWLAAAAAAMTDDTAATATSDALTQADWAISRSGDPPRQRTAWNLLAANDAVNSGDRGRAVELYRRAAAVAAAEPLLHGQRAAALGQLSSQLGDDARAVEVYREFLTSPATIGEFERDERSTLTRELAEALYRLGRSREARDAIAPLLAPAAGATVAERLSAEVIAATIDDDLGDSAAAKARLERVEREAGVQLGAAHPMLADIALRLASVLRSLDDGPGAIAAARRAIERFAATGAPSGPGAIYAHNLIGDVARVQGDVALAISELGAACRDGDAAFGVDNPMAAQLRVSYASALAAAGRRDEAVREFEAALQVFTATRFAPDVIADAEFELARTIVAIDRPRALALARGARTRLLAPDLLETTVTERTKIDAWLAQHTRR